MSLSTLPPDPAAVPDALAERLADPHVAASLAAVLDRMDVVALVVTALDGLLAHSETILDSAVESFADAKTTVEANDQAKGIDVGASTDAAVQLLAALPNMAPALVRGAESGAIDHLTSPALVELLGLLSDASGRALADPRPVEVGGVLSLARSLRDPDVQRALGFLLTVARALGQRLNH